MFKELLLILIIILLSFICFKIIFGGRTHLTKLDIIDCYIISHGDSSQVLHEEDSLTKVGFKILDHRINDSNYKECVSFLSKRSVKDITN